LLVVEDGELEVTPRNISESVGTGVLVVLRTFKLYTCIPQMRHLPLVITRWISLVCTFSNKTTFDGTAMLPVLTARVSS
jgi:hypothetical protein